MNPWDFTLNFKDVVLDFSFLSAFLILGTVSRRYGTFFQKYLIPNNIIAGFIGLIIGPQILVLTSLSSLLVVWAGLLEIARAICEDFLFPPAMARSISKS